MYEFYFNQRYTYSETVELWNAIEEIKSDLPEHSLEYTVVERDQIIFQLCYSYGLRPLEALNLSILDCNFDKFKNNSEYFGSIFINCRNNILDFYQLRVVYPIFPEVTEKIAKFLKTYDEFSKYKENTKLFISSKGNPLTLHYMNNRLNYYNSKVLNTKKIHSLHVFRQYYISDLLRINGLPQSFINNQIGNNTINNQTYLHLKPNN